MVFSKMLLVLLFVGLCTPLSGDPSCNNTKTMQEVQDCRSAVDSKTGTGKPTAACCQKLKMVNRACLCAVLHMNPPPQGIDLAKAAKLPVQCNLPGPATC